ncbi:LOW QUALITY PROTEIN: hypothetical protein V2J09_010718 [Rumex salicifolius]
MKDLGEPRYFLGLERKYTLELLEEEGVLNAKPTCLWIKLTLEGSTNHVNQLSYRKVVGKLIYLTITRPDVCYVVYSVSSCMHQKMSTDKQPNMCSDLTWSMIDVKQELVAES